MDEALNHIFHIHATGILGKLSRNCYYFRITLVFKAQKIRAMNRFQSVTNIAEWYGYNWVVHTVKTVITVDTLTLVSFYVKWGASFDMNQLSPSLTLKRRILHKFCSLESLSFLIIISVMTENKMPMAIV